MSLIGKPIEIRWDFGEIGGELIICGTITSLKIADLTSEMMLDISSPVAPLIVWDNKASQFRAKLRDPLKPFGSDEGDEGDLVSVRIGANSWPST